MTNPSSGTSLRENLIGIGAMVTCNLVFLVNDTLLKLANANLPLGEIIFFRGLFASILMSAIVFGLGLHRQFGMLVSFPVFWRTVAEIGGAFFYLFALFHIPIANANAILQGVPLMITAAGAVFLGERVGWKRWTAIAVGFLGVLVIVRPGLAGFDGYSVWALGAMLFITLRDVATRIIKRGVHVLLIAWITAVAVCLSGIAFGVSEAWTVPDWRSLGLLAAAAVLAITGYLTAVQAMRHGDISVVAPFRYTVVIFAIVVGFIVWSEVPDALMLAGTAIITATGIYTLYRERKIANLAAEAMAGEGM